MGESAAFVAADPATRQVTDPSTIPLLRRVVESLVVMRPGRYSLYLGRPDPAEVRAEWDQESRLMQSARRAVVATPETTPLPAAAERRDPGLGWLTRVWFNADGLGGSATYFALAAHHFAAVRVVATVGPDFHAKFLKAMPEGVDLRGVVASKLPTYRWIAEHDYTTGKTSSETSHQGAYAE